MASDTSLNELTILQPEGSDSQNTFVGHRFRLLPTSEDFKQMGSVTFEVKGEGTVSVELKGDHLEAKTEFSPAKQGQAFLATQLDDTAIKKLGQEKAEECLQNLKVARDNGDTHAVMDDAETFCNKFPTREFISSKVAMNWDTWQNEMEVGPWKHLKHWLSSQPGGLKNFTDSGYKLLKRHEADGQPPFGEFFKPSFKSDVDNMIQWYEDFRKTARPEEHGIYDPSVSSYESDTWVARPPAALSAPIVKEIQRGLEKWAGVPEDSLQFINFYGVRMYRNTSLLRRHVDIWETHVLSAIVNVGKRGLTSPWPLQLVTHDGSVHQVDDSPGDVIFYESASCPHGRDSGRLQGREVANMFIHFRPQNWEPLEGSHLKSNGNKVLHQPAEL